MRLMIRFSLEICKEHLPIAVRPIPNKNPIHPQLKLEDCFCLFVNNIVVNSDDVS